MKKSENAAGHGAGLDEKAPKGPRPKGEPGIKRGLASLLLATALLLGPAFSTASASQGKTRFLDVAPGMWYARAIHSLADQGIVSGAPDGFFHPQSPATRAQFLSMLAKASGQDVSGNGYQEQFSDVNASDWYADCVYWGLKEKVVSGVEENRFAPDAPITRQQMAGILCRFNKYAMGKLLPQKEGPTKFRDAGSISGWAVSEVEAVTRAGLMKGYKDKTFQPKKTATRAEAAQLVYLYLKACSDYRQGCSIDELRHIVHGGGMALDAYRVSNSLEALEEARASGNRLIEVDFSWTTDDQLACVHQWGGEYPEACTLQEFLNTRIFGSLTPLDLDALIQWLRKYPEIRVIPDLKERNLEGLLMIVQRYPDMVQRFLPYALERSQVTPIREMGYENVFLMLYRMPLEEQLKVQENASFARKSGVTALILGASGDVEAYGRAGRKNTVPILVFTVNDPEKEAQYAAQGVDGFISDRQSPQISW